MIAAAGAVVFFFASQFISLLNEWPRELRVNPAQAMNDALTYIVINFRLEIEAIKKFAFFFVMLPTKIGLQQAVSPFTWGFQLTLAHSIGYALVMTALAAWCAHRWNNQIGVSVLLFAIFFYFGLTNMPWPALMLIYAGQGMLVRPK